MVFFCGAGVSQAKARLPGFYELARRVVQILGVPSDSPAIALLDQAHIAEERTGLTGLIPADRIFGILERDFLVRDVEKAVATALQPPDAPDLSAHVTLLDLATAPEGEVRIVTTNFDRLFDDCDRDVQSWQRPYLPDPSRPGDINGVVYLHGKAAADYRSATGDGFVLSSSAFGRAYLADGWATSFFQQIIREYVVVFVGYAADDPPVQYLLEALNTRTDRPDRIYAFQSGEADEAASKWRHKGVAAIPYRDHPALWSTLDAWAVRARDPNAWYDSVVGRALRGPEELSPSERGQVAHVAATLEGLRKFLDNEPSPPADWLCVFDPRIRYGDPGRSGTWRNPGPIIDPFDFYGIDSDTPPPRADAAIHPKPRNVPPSAWDAFALNRFDKRDWTDDLAPYFRGRGAATAQHLTRRLSSMARWLAEVAGQPTAVWWAARQGPLHPAICHLIRWAIRHSHAPTSKVVREAWLYLFECWEQSAGDDEELCDRVVAQLSTDDWSAKAVRQYGAACRPYLKAGPAWWWCGPKPPPWSDEIRLAELVHLEVVYPRAIEEDIEIPEEWLASVVVELRKNLEISWTLETEIGGLGLGHVAPISRPHNPNQQQFGPVGGLSGLLRRFSATFERLGEVDMEAGRREFSRWPVNDDAIFARLRIWAASNADLVPNESCGLLFSDLSDYAFWDIGHQPDLLLTMASRWTGLRADVRQTIQARLLNGRPRRENEEGGEFRRRRARLTLDRLTWMSRQGCDLGRHVDRELQRLRELAPDWRPEHADDAAESTEGEGGFVTTRTEYTALSSEALTTTLSRARELAGNSQDFLVEEDPYRGLSAAKPVRAFTALSVAAKGGEHPDWAWTTFLTVDARKNDRARFMALIAERLARCPSEALSGFLPAASRWLRDVGQVLAREHPSSFRVAARSLIRVVEQYPAAVGPQRVGRGPRSWATEAINSATGMLVETLLFSAEVHGLAARDGLPAALVEHLNRLLALDGNLSRYALAILSSRLLWLYSVDRNWSEANLLCTLESQDEEAKAAFWSGFFWGAYGTWHPRLYSRLKDHLLRLAAGRGEEGRPHGQTLPGLILAGWGAVDETRGGRYVSNEELRDVLLRTDDGFRGAILWHAEKWLRGAEGGRRARSAVLVPELLREVWPRQKSVKTPAMSARLFGLAVGNEGEFRELAEVVEPLLSGVEGDRIVLPHLGTARNVIDEHPREMLGLLYAVLPDRAGAWPYDTGAVLERIWEADETLRADNRLRELRRRWDAR